MKTHKLILNSDPNSIRLVKTWVDNISMKYNVCEELYPDILICLTEAVNNAIHHGNKRDVNKNISLICIVEKGRLQFLPINRVLMICGRSIWPRIWIILRHR